jgi:hypothetical protein
VNCWSSSPTFKNCRFTNHAGAALMCVYSDASFENCLFQNNGALYWIVVDCVSGTPVFSRCMFLHNNTQTMYLDFTFAKITNCLFHGNVSQVLDTVPHSIIELHGGMPTITNCTLTGNTAPSGAAAVLLAVEPSALIRNSILWGNAPSEILVSPGEASYTQVTYCDVTGGYAGAGNINTDPFFVNPGGQDFDLGPGSPCIDSGDNAAVASGVIVDLPGRPRFVDDPATPDGGVGTPPIVDRGAYEFQPGMVLGDLDCDGSVNVSDISSFVMALTDPSGYAQQYPSCGILRGDLNQDSLVNGLDIDPFVECIIGGTCP